ncbi:Hypothetical predicted protein [Pelobates cultripes]|uniref:Uncharacterized protein n=1 Tax=Pelobates cultripes TaxID=61616 RepID=A0AAD1SDP0_PELCU|nr:Hypothetical predicted protein [Pelobates cultripes]
MRQDISPSNESAGDPSLDSTQDDTLALIRQELSMISVQMLTKVDMGGLLRELRSAIKEEIMALRADLMAVEALETEAQASPTTHQGNLLLSLLRQVEDLENRSRRQNIWIRGLPEPDTAPLQETLKVLFRQILGQECPAEIQLDRAHRALGPQRLDSRPRDVLCCLYAYSLKERLMAAARDSESIHFRGADVALFQDLYGLTLDARRAIRPLTTTLRDKGIAYRWGFPFSLQIRQGNTWLHVRWPEDVPRALRALHLPNIRIRNWLLDSLLAPHQDTAGEYRPPPTPREGARAPRMLGGLRGAEEEGIFCCGVPLLSSLRGIRTTGGGGEGGQSDVIDLLWDSWGIALNGRREVKGAPQSKPEQLRDTGRKCPSLKRREGGIPHYIARQPTVTVGIALRQCGEEEGTPLYVGDPLPDIDGVLGLLWGRQAQPCTDFTLSRGGGITLDHKGWGGAQKAHTRSTHYPVPADAHAPTDTLCKLLGRILLFFSLTTDTLDDPPTKTTLLLRTSTQTTEHPYSDRDGSREPQAHPPFLPSFFISLSSLPTPHRSLCSCDSPYGLTGHREVCPGTPTRLVHQRLGPEHPAMEVTFAESPVGKQGLGSPPTRDPFSGANGTVLRDLRYPMGYFANHRDNKKAGVAILFATHVPFVCTEVKTDPLGRYIFIKGSIAHKRLHIRTQHQTASFRLQNLKTTGTPNPGRGPQSTNRPPDRHLKGAQLTARHMHQNCTIGAQNGGTSGLLENFTPGSQRLHIFLPGTPWL